MCDDHDGSAGLGVPVTWTRTRDDHGALPDLAAHFPAPRRHRRRSPGPGAPFRRRLEARHRLPPLPVRGGLHPANDGQIVGAARQGGHSTPTTLGFTT